MYKFNVLVWPLELTKIIAPESALSLEEQFIGVIMLWGIIYMFINFLMVF